MTRELTPKYKIIQDTREQQGLYFGPYEQCEGMVTRKLDTGDYTIEGLEDKICIERKASVEEIAINLGQKKHPFMAEIQRMSTFDHKFLILEFSVDDVLKFPEGTRIPEEKKKTLKITGKYLMKCLNEFEIHDGIHVVFCGNKHNAFMFLSGLFKRLYEKYTIGKRD